MTGDAAGGQSEQVKPERGIDVKDRLPEKAQVRRLRLERGLLRAVTKLALAIATDALTGGRPVQQHLRSKACKVHLGLLLTLPACMPANCVMCDVAEQSDGSWPGSLSQIYNCQCVEEAWLRGQCQEHMWKRHWLHAGSTVAAGVAEKAAGHMSASTAMLEETGLAATWASLLSLAQNPPHSSRADLEARVALREDEMAVLQRELDVNRVSSEKHVLSPRSEERQPLSSFSANSWCLISQMLGVPILGAKEEVCQQRLLQVYLAGMQADLNQGHAEVNANAHPVHHRHQATFAGFNLCCSLHVVGHSAERHHRIP